MMSKPTTTVMNMATWNKAVLRLTAVLLLGLTVLAAAAQVPPRPDPPRLVNDFAGILGDCQWLEDSLEKIAVETSNQICVVTMDDLGGYDKAMMAYSIGQQWGVGTQRHRNGVVILVKPKTADSKGDAFIATGYGLEGGITDAACRRIVLGLILFICILALFLFLAHQSNQGNGGNHRNNGDTGTWGGPIIFTSGSDWGRGGSSWGGGGSFGGGGGWGGFGGGSFGGGGGGGSW